MVVWAGADRGKKSLPIVLPNEWAIVPNGKTGLSQVFKGVL